MRVSTERLAHGAQLDWARAGAGESGDALTVLVGGGRGCVFQATGLPAAIWIPLRGRLQIAASDGTQVLTSGDLLCTEADQRLQVVGRGNALWVALIGTRPAWRQLLANATDLPVAEPCFFPARHLASRPMRRVVLRLLRSLLDARRGEHDIGGIAAALAVNVLDLQRSFDALIARCPGRTLAQRRAVFLRLQRVRNYMIANCQLDLDIDALARLASYSSWHFIRAFRAVFGETPHALLVADRLERARSLLHRSELAVAEVALAAGFENRCAFSRMFKRHFGVTAASMRRDAVLARAAA